MSAPSNAGSARKNVNCSIAPCKTFKRTPKASDLGEKANFFRARSISSLNSAALFGLMNVQAHERMNSAAAIVLPEVLSESQREALLKLLADDDSAIYQTVRQKIVSCGPTAAGWLRPHLLSREPALRRRVQEIILYFDRQAADNRFLGLC